MSKELIQRAKKGNIDALNELIEKYKSVAFSIAFKYLKNKEDAEDITQNAFIIVLRSIKKFRNESKFSTWLYKIIYHECLKVLKSRNLMIEYIPEFTQIEAAEVKDETKKVDHKIDELLSH
ncbi:sigma-70 family RNA polymerase sigma factor, partial [Oceanospirillum sp. D5]|nr:sigma-70 family RNA polymerase sigma factor [Oceanospirillum sediminis]